MIVKWQELVNHRNLTNEQPASKHLKNCPPRQALCYLHDVHTVCTHFRWSAPNSLFAKGELVRLAAHTYILSYLAHIVIPCILTHTHKCQAPSYNCMLVNCHTFLYVLKLSFLPTYTRAYPAFLHRPSSTFSKLHISTLSVFMQCICICI